MGWLDWILDPLAYGFMWRGLLAALMVGVLCSVLGTYVILQGMAFFGDALAHAILPGVVIAYLAGWPLALGALVFGVITAVGIGALSHRGQIREDTAIGIIFAGSFALGVALLSTVRSYAVDLAHILFGDVLGVSPTDLWFTFGLGALVLLIVFALYKEILVLAFDPTLAVVLRLPATFLRYLMLVLIAVTIVVSLQTVGVALVLAMLVTPAAAAQLLTRRLPSMMAVAALIGAFSNVTGLYLSYYVNVASGPAMVLVATAIFLLAFTFAPRRGLLWQMARRRRALGTALSSQSS
ncbi:metal ABC transporter permease [Litorilinea aerophila]|uniref:Metal ABC transporter permease n=1 Tax=Litorilinea aerophila TaxID=1204385 RepID=A0A540VM87_9CHLR|nr:metal ABC transporter permease [Litorilinea aerophila]MCC9074560.1 metal ABC transporter permease [Litorilinea aerophila]GIV75709.1 MAG: membrane protein [Litorilinea sp.]